MDTGELIEALGGPTVVAADLGFRIARVGNWTMRGAIPREHHLAVWRVAMRKNVAWTPPDADGLVLAPAPPPPPTPAPTPKLRRPRRTPTPPASAAPAEAAE
jgi:hypothetical protein